MKQCFILIIVVALSNSFINTQEISTQYEPSAAFPFGMVNPDAPQQVKDFEPMIGISDYESLSLNPDGTWQNTSKMVWKFKYITNGTALQDEV